MTKAKYVGRVVRVAGHHVGFSKRCSPGKLPQYRAFYPSVYKPSPRSPRVRAFAGGAATSYGLNKAKYRRDPYVFDKGWWR